jgi:integrase
VRLLTERRINMHPSLFPIAPLTPSLEELIQKTKNFVASAKSPATLKAYRNDWRDFESWCRAHYLPSLPSTPETVALYISDRASTHAVGTITRRLTSITKAHQAAGHKESPASTHHFVVGETLKGVRRVLGTKQKGKDPLLAEDIRKIVGSSPDRTLGLRDRALVLVGFAGAFRRSELAQIRVSDLSFNKDGVIIDIRVSKTDQEGVGRKVGIPFAKAPETCPVRALTTWLEGAKISEGAVFRRVDRNGLPSRRGLHKDSIGKILKRAVARAGMQVDSLGGHSLRAGCVTQAAMNGVREFIIMKQTGHKTVTALRRYIRSGEIFRENAATDLGI